MSGVEEFDSVTRQDKVSGVGELARSADPSGCLTACTGSRERVEGGGGGGVQGTPFESPLNGTSCNAAVGVKAFFDMMHIGPHKVMLFGAACTQVTDPVAKASRRWRLTQLSYADTHPMFTKENFPNFFRVVPSENAFNAPRLRLLQEFNWTRVGTIYQNEPRYSLAHNHLVADLDERGLEVVETQSFTNEVASAMAKLKEKDVRIILGNFNESWARRIFCEAHRAEMFGRKYQWLIMGTYAEEWWLQEEGLVPCSSAELMAALEGCILTDLLPLSTNGEITVSGITAQEYQLEYDSRRGGEYSRFHGYTYDGVWAVALAIQYVAHRVRHVRKNHTIVDFRYRDPLWEQLFLEALKNTSFEGVTGPVRFYDNERKASILLKQFQNGSEAKVGEFHASPAQLDLGRGAPIRWHGRAPPKDRTLQLIEHSHVNITVYSVLAATASLGIVMAVTFLSINIMYRNQRYIKMSSPYLNNLIIIGCMLTYSSVIFLGLDSTLTSEETFPYVCTARAWLLMAGFSLAFGSMFSKTWRVHSIFTDVKLNKKVIKDYQLFMVVGVLLVIDLAIMTTWQVTDPFFLETKQMEPYPDPSSEDVLIVPVNEYCQSGRMTVFVSSIYAYKGLLMVFGAFLAWETRHVSIPALNDSKYVGMSVYNVVIMCVMGAAISFVLSDKQDASFIIISVFIIFCTTGTLCLVFVPKLIELRRNPQGSIDKRMIRATLRPSSKSRRDSEASELEEKLKDASAANQKYKKKLAEKDAELHVLVQRLGDDTFDLNWDSGMDRLAVPRQDMLRREDASRTETTEISSLCSLNSSQDGEYVNLTVETPGSRKKAVFPARPPTIAAGGGPGKEAAAILRRRSGGSVCSGSEASDKHVPGSREDDAEPLIAEAAAAELGLSNAHFLPEPLPEDQLPPEEKSLIRELMGERPRLATPPPPLHLHHHHPASKVVSFGGAEEDTILPPPRQFHPRRSAAPPPEQQRRRSSVKVAVAAAAAGPEQRRVSLPAVQHHAGCPAAARSSRARAAAVAPPPGGGPPPLLLDGGELLRSGNASSPNVAAMVKTSPRGLCAMYVVGSRPVSLRLVVGGCRWTLADLEEGSPGGMQRSVSEKSRDRCAATSHRHHHHHQATSTSTSTSTKQQQQQSLRQHKSALVSSHVHHSTPNVASIRGGASAAAAAGVAAAGGGGRRDAADARSSTASVAGLCSAVSEGELLDLAILPIFQKLLSERHKSRRGYGAAVASCPNISIKCDIVEYL
ncbi:gamma-aminobutyric acid type B receptor subunit 2 [Bacillus rossius redtenbacheri]|uniref:gamma-aminobutyric acid type B receptor subunit 2 n=1 Tax=Bacillus rossius redtenbacheri TaxID=93214 RepID=UPI002FDE930C